MIVAVDIGNTNIVVGGFENGTLCFVLRLPSDRKRNTAAYVRDLGRLLCGEGVTLSDAEGCILSSVVPELLPILSAALRKLTGKTPLTVDEKLDSGLAIRNYDPERLGSDRVVDAVAALARYAPPLAIFDLGTATTLSVLDRDGVLIGGMIMSGVRLGVDALSARAAQLPPIELERPDRWLGTDTVSCMQCGAIYGAAAMLDGLTERVETALGETVTMVVTGGLSSHVVPYCRHAVQYEEQLLLHGLYLIFQRHAQDRREVVDRMG